jgi:hypothetical protein
MSEQPSIQVSFQTSVNLDAEVDMVTYFTHLPESWRKGYFETDLDNSGYGEEWERPLAYLVSLMSENAMGLGVFDRGIKAGFGDGDIEDDWRIKRRVRMEPEDQWDSEVNWTEKHFSDLVEQVPWLDPERWSADQERRAEMLSRMPGPYDVPLPFDA